MIRKIDLIPSSAKLLFAVCYDFIALGLAFFLAYFLRLGASHLNITTAEWSVFTFVVLGTTLMFYFLGTYRTVVRYFSAKETLKVVGILLVSCILFYLAGNFFNAFVPRSVPIVFFAIAALMVGGARAAFALVTNDKWFDEREPY